MAEGHGLARGLVDLHRDGVTGAKRCGLVGLGVAVVGHALCRRPARTRVATGHEPEVDRVLELADPEGPSMPEQAAVLGYHPRSNPVA